MTLDVELNEFNNLIINMHEDKQLSKNNSVFEVIYAWSQIRDKLVERVELKC